MAAEIYSTEFLVTQIMLVLQQAIDGYGFSPKEEELINYLKLEVPGCRGGFCIIPTIENIYQIDPWELPAKFHEKSIIPSNDREWWFICPQLQNRRIPRKTPCGSSWKITGGHTDINAKADGQKIGSKTILGFPDSRASKGGKSNWVIHEYRLLTEDLSRNSVMCHLMHKQDEKADNSTTRPECGAEGVAGLKSLFDQPDDEGSFPEHVIQGRMKVQHQHQVRFSLSHLLQLFQHGLQLLSNSFPCTINQFTSIGSPSVKDCSLDKSLSDISVISESSLGASKDDEWLKLLNAMVDADLSNAEAQKGEEPRLEKVQQEAAAINNGPCIFSDETAARAKNGQTSVMENRGSKSGTEDGVEETEDIFGSTFNGPHFSDFSDLESYYDNLAAEELEYTEQNLDGNSPKRRRLNTPEKE